MLSSTLGGFFMQYRTYSAEYKMSMINEYLTRDITIRNFVKEKDIGLSTFESWLTKLRKAGQLGYKKDKVVSKNGMLPIDVTNEAKTIIKEESAKSSNVFTLETKGMKLTFSIYNLKEVLKVINND